MVSKGIEDTHKIAEEAISLFFKSNKKEGAMVVALSGDLGAGKTAFTQSVGRILGIKEKIISPTFVIMKHYKTKNSNFKKLVHIDAYRLENGKELEKLRFTELLGDPANLILIEWPEMVKEIMPKKHRKISIKHLDEDSREFEIKI